MQIKSTMLHTPLDVHTHSHSHSHTHTGMVTKQMTDKSKCLQGCGAT